jgi:hypothetical protein
MILDESIKALISYRLESAREKLSAAEDLFEKRHYKDSVSRSYYAIFTAARAMTPKHPWLPLSDEELLHKAGFWRDDPLTGRLRHLRQALGI